ncbi:leucine-rich repeat, immunoglobulin-like domain and transmembrane domain-containing protein 1b isoform X1 [Triplophysa dalaica]|uniref:leucine-rich repeat, immunoglobulin-like domain and transmembrane domain-containing protein 1b isoform X1 n=2 Tax=Triplophysa dalaica TaxID=1582913 RepID=UPI0024E01C3B|nr:leucine-rich repeat, immunoglobulin-like domain and transmembrane domain-containing protein 1b isoform X1 [Triplophysa dalaica]
MSTCVFFISGLLLCCLPLLCSTCPPQCSCFYHKLSDGSKSRSVLCNDPELTDVPKNFPSDTSKLRIEKTAISQVTADTFHYLNSLEYLWISFNSLSSLSEGSFHGLYALDELRMDGNLLISFPWECLMDTPNLRLLDLHNNKINSIPVEATFYIKNLTYLDLSSNNLATVPAEVLSSWFSVKPPQDAENSKMILGLHDNPWRCDCRLFDLVQFQKSSVAFIDTRLRCAEPEGLSGVLFSDAELRKCQSPRVHTAVARVRSSIGNNVLLRCGTIGVPIPELSWSRADGKPMNASGKFVQQEISKEGIMWSILSVPAVSYRDSGKYVCKATNLVGSADAIISLVISDTWQIDEVAKKPHSKKSSGRAAYQEKLIARYVPPAPTPAAVPIIQPLNGPKATAAIKIESYSISEDSSDAPPAAVPLPDNSSAEVEKDVLSNLEANASSLQQGPERRVVRSVKVIGDTDHAVSLNWRAPSATNTTSFSVLYAVFGERDMRRINVGPGKNRVTIQGLVPKTKYIACVCVKGLIPKKEQCVIFSTDEAASASGTQKLINVVVITVACVIAVPLTLIVCCGALKRRLQKLLGRKSKDIQDSYVTFETLSPGTKAKGLEGEYLTRLNPDESNRLLSARSSVDSEATARTEGQPNEYFC